LVKYRWSNIGAVSGRWTWIKLSTITGTTDNTNQLVYNATGIPAPGNGISAILEAQVYLHSTTGATKSMFGKSFDIHVEVDKLGSREEVVE
jgi:hypothetical protein